MPVNLQFPNLPEWNVPDQAGQLTKALGQLQTTAQALADQRKARNLTKARNLLVTRIQSDPTFASKLSSNLGAILPALPEAQQPGMIQSAMSQQERQQIEREKMQMRAQTKALPKPISDTVLTTMMNKVDLKSVAPALKALGADDAFIDAFTQMKLNTPPGAEIVTIQNRQFVKQPSGTLVPLSEPKPATEPDLNTLAGQQALQQTGGDAVAAKALLADATRKPESPEESDAYNPDAPMTTKRAENLSKSFRSNVAGNLFVKQFTDRQLSSQMQQAYAMTDQSLQNDPSFTPDQRARALKVLKNVSGIGHMYQFMRDLDKSVVRPSELALIQLASLSAGHGDIKPEAMKEELRRWWNNEGTSLNPAAEAVFKKLQELGVDQAQRDALEQMTIALYAHRGILGKNQANNDLVAAAGNPRLAQRVITLTDLIEQNEAQNSGGLTFQGLVNTPGASAQPIQTTPATGTPVAPMPNLGGVPGSIPVNTGVASGSTDAYTGPRSMPVDGFNTSRDAFKALKKGLTP